LLTRVFAGETAVDIAASLRHSRKTVENTLARARRQLGVRRDVDAFREALLRGLVTLEEIDRRRRERGG
jgi:DNA-binding CsgD family transcriptional regulator